MRLPKQSISARCRLLLSDGVIPFSAIFLNCNILRLNDLQRETPKLKKEIRRNYLLMLTEFLKMYPASALDKVGLGEALEGSLPC